MFYFNVISFAIMYYSLFIWECCLKLPKSLHHFSSSELTDAFLERNDIISNLLDWLPFVIYMSKYSKLRTAIVDIVNFSSSNVWFFLPKTIILLVDPLDWSTVRPVVINISHISSNLASDPTLRILGKN